MAKARLLAFHLPQFHAIPENDAWWGEGFTEWTNVRRAAPLFPGHTQPRSPGRLGYYTLTDPHVLRAQAALARSHGIEGFCFYHYHFAPGVRLLEKPVDLLLADRDIDLPFCLCWANENWTRRWDGREHEILMPQRQDADTLADLTAGLATCFRDPRYIRVDGKPLLLIYNTRALHHPREALATLRARFADHGFPAVHVTAALTFGELDPSALGVDQAVQFPPHNRYLPPMERPAEIARAGFDGDVLDYRVYADMMGRIALPEFPTWPGVISGWDNTPRRGRHGTVFLHSNPLDYHRWLARAIEASAAAHPPESAFVFINAWNEWAEGTYLEPDVLWGDWFLAATRLAVADQPLTPALRERLATDGPPAAHDLRLLDVALEAASLAKQPMSSDPLEWLDLRNRHQQAKQRVAKLRDKVKRLKAGIAEQRNEHQDFLTWRIIRPLAKLERSIRMRMGRK